MQCRAAYIVQSMMDFTFLRCDGEGGVETTMVYSGATPFDHPEAAMEAVQDHCDGRGSVVRIWVPE